MSIAFLMMILGFLLGKSTSDRHHSVREHLRQQNEVNRQDDIVKIENALVDFAAFKTPTNVKTFYNENYDDFQEHIKEHFVQCLDTSYQNTTVDSLEEFVKYFVREEYKNFKLCAYNLKDFLSDVH